MKFLTVNGKFMRTSNGKLITVPDNYNNEPLKLNGKLLTFGGAVIGSKGAQTKLATPQNVTVDGTTASWDEVENATSYELFSDGTSIGTFTKGGGEAPHGYQLIVTEEFEGGTFSITYADGTVATVSAGTYQNVISITDYSPNAFNEKWNINGSMPKLPFTLTANSTAYIYSSCLTGDMLVTLADGSQKRIDQLTLNDRVLSYNPDTMQLEADEITYTDSTENKKHTEYDIWTFSDGTIVKTVHRHRLYNVERQAMVYMDEWKIGEHAVNINDEYVELVGHENVKEEVRHYTLFTKNQNYFVNGLLSGNRHTKEVHL